MVETKTTYITEKVRIEIGHFMPEMFTEIYIRNGTGWTGECSFNSKGDGNLEFIKSFGNKTPHLLTHDFAVFIEKLDLEYIDIYKQIKTIVKEMKNSKKWNQYISKTT